GRCHNSPSRPNPWRGHRRNRELPHAYRILDVGKVVGWVEEKRVLSLRAFPKPIIHGKAVDGFRKKTREERVFFALPILRRTPEYQRIFEENLEDQIRGGLGNISTARCRPAGMPHMMMAFGPQEYVITPDVTYIMIDWDDHSRRIFTDGRDWPAELEPSWSG